MKTQGGECNSTKIFCQREISPRCRYVTELRAVIFKYGGPQCYYKLRLELVGLFLLTLRDGTMKTFHFLIAQFTSVFSDTDDPYPAAGVC